MDNLSRFAAGSALRR